MWDWEAAQRFIHPAWAGKKQGQCCKTFIAGIYIGPVMVPWVAVSPPNAKGSEEGRKSEKTFQLVQLMELPLCFNIKI